MHGTVDSSCIGCGLCTNILPEVFHLNASGLAQGGSIPPEQEAAAQEAQNSCPVGAIHLEA